MSIPALYRPATSIIGTDLSVTLDGWSASGLAVDAQGTEWWLTGLDGWFGTPPMRLGGVDRPLDHGQFDGPSYLGARIITAAGTAIATDRTAALVARDIMSSLCWDPSQLYALQVTEPGRPTRRCAVRLNADTKISEINPVGFDWQIQWKAPDPRRYDDNETAVTLTVPTGALGGLTAPLTVPFSISTSGTSGSTAAVTNAGTIATRPTVTFNGPLVDPQIANLTAMRNLSFTITLAAGDTLVVDFDRRTALLNGTASRSSALTATAAWWELAPGGNDVAFTAGGGDGNAVLRFRSAWL